MTYEYYSHQSAERALDFRDERVLKGPSIQRVLNALSPEKDDLVVDTSRGEGEYTLALSRLFSEAKGGGVVFSCDLDSEILETRERAAERTGVSQHLYPVQLNVAAPFRLPFRDEQVDCILSIDRVPWKSDPRPYLQEYARILKPCGTLVLGETDRRLRYESPEWITPIPKSEMRYPLLQESGFDIFSSVDISNYLWVERVMKPVIVLSA